MKTLTTLLFTGLILGISACNAQKEQGMKTVTTTDTIKNVNTMKTINATQYNPLTPQQADVILHKATDYPHTGEYTKKKDAGMYICRQCNAPLYRSQDKFESHCGWPSFDDEIKGSVKRVPDADGSRVEIVCNNCQGHLGHVFEGEGFTDKDTRHCVNTSSILFVPADKIKDIPPTIVLTK